LVFYVCAYCGQKYLSNTGYESDKPNGYYIELREVVGGRYSHHRVTPEPMFYCSKECLLAGLQTGLDKILVPSTPPDTAASSGEPSAPLT